MIFSKKIKIYFDFSLPITILSCKYICLQNIFFLIYFKSKESTKKNFKSTNKKDNGNDNKIYHTAF